MAREEDAEQIAAIYAPVVRETAISFEVDPPDAPEMRERIARTVEQYPWLVCETAGEVRGYAYAGAHRTRAAYQWAVDTTVYVHALHRRKGVGRALYTALLGVLPLQRYYNAYAGIALPNPGSVRLHEAVGFVPLGIYHQVGFKLGKWNDVGWWECVLQEHTAPDGAPIPVSAVQETVEWKTKVALGLEKLRDA